MSIKLKLQTANAALISRLLCSFVSDLQIRVLGNSYICKRTYLAFIERAKVGCSQICAFTKIYIILFDSIIQRIHLNSLSFSFNSRQTIIAIWSLIYISQLITVKTDFLYRLTF